MMLTAPSKELASASLFSVVLRFVLSFLVSPQSQFVLSPLLVVHTPNWLLAMWEPLGVGGSAVGLIVTLKAFN